MDSKKEIIICDKCKGTGILKKTVRVTGYESEIRNTECDRCLGTGRLQKTTSYVPFWKENI